MGSDIAPEAILTIALLMLICIGVVMVYSASSATALLSDESPQGLLIRQGIYAVIGLIAFAACARLKPSRLIALGKPAIIVSIAALVVVLMPGIGIMANGSRRWIGLGPVQVQPAEFAKLAIILWLAGYLCKNAGRLDEFKTMRLPVITMAAMAGLIVVEPDLGTAVVLVGVALAMIAIAGAPARVMALITLGAVTLGALGIAAEPYRRSRMLAFLDPWADTKGAGFQIVQSKLAIGSGGVSGTGLGNGLQKVFYLPEAHTDMIMATVGEELGLIGFIGVIVLVGAVVWSGYRIALSAPDSRQRLLAGGLTSLIGIQAIVNLGAVLGMLPVTGVPLPFMSYGGSSLVVFAAASGILVGIGRRSRARRSRNLTVVRSGDEPAHRDRGGRDGRAHHAGARAG
ncbi:MAG: putative lipid II flippase FtsW [Thermoleophilia bacterium]